MARRRASVPAWGTVDRDGSVDGLFSAMRTTAQDSLGRPVSIGQEFGEDHVGLPFPALCLRYLHQSTTFPLSRITQITGEEGSAKSSYAYEIMRWHAVYGGGAVLLENENKDARDFRSAIWQWNERWLARCTQSPTYSMEQWQDGLTRFTEIARAQQDAAGGPGRTVPICFAIDSITATAPQAEIDEINKCGHATRGFALLANLISRYMRTMPDRLRNYPFSVVGTNHQKPATTPTGLPTSTIPGGMSVKFMETFQIEMTKTMNKDIDRLEYGGLRIRFICKKNSIGPSRKSITAELLWWYDQDAEGKQRQQAVWDWDTASVELLLSFENAPGKVTIFRRLQEICDIRVTNKASRLAWSNALGIPQSDPQPYRVIGSALERRADLLVPIYAVLGIMPRRPFQPGIDYSELQRTAAADAAAAEVRLYTDDQVVPLVTTAGIANTDTVQPEVAPQPGEEDIASDE